MLFLISIELSKKVLQLPYFLFLLINIFYEKLIIINALSHKSNLFLILLSFPRVINNLVYIMNVPLKEPQSCQFATYRRNAV